MEWSRYANGRGWRIDEQGFIEVEDQGIPRTKGEPKTIRHLLAQYGEYIARARDELGIDPCWILGMIPIEAKMRPRPGKGQGLEADPKSLRHEPGYITDPYTPHRVSAGLMQTLLSTAQDMAKVHGWNVPRFAHQLYDPETSIMLGAAYMAHQAKRYEDGIKGCPFDFVFLTGAYNAGGVYQDMTNPFHLRTYSPTRTTRAIQWHNDARAVLIEAEGWNNA